MMWPHGRKEFFFGGGFMCPVRFGGGFPVSGIGG